jgi:hypothetical protein
MAKVSIDPKQLSLVIVEKMQNDKISRADLARATGIHPSQVGRICDGDFRRLGGNVMQICNLLHVDPRSDDLGHARRLTAAVLTLWDKTADDAERLIRLLNDLREVRGAVARSQRNVH